MQLGTRWAFGDRPPASVPADLAARVAEAEGARPGEEGHWTLTWLEGRPIAELDDGTRVTLEGTTAPGEARSDDDW
ncbi:hypothetical protein [Agromyces salentinus]|uniref:Fe-S oxidoreductase n=1 Tax=Agromyces salentinus TaxID=269421 RepID=A0ABP4ZB03_9MICO|nr:hypothetical protein [Agromyces salentinus]